MKSACILVILSFLSLYSNAQELTAEDLKEYFLDAEFFFAQEEYADALFEYQELHDNGYSDIANINYRMGVCYLNLPGQKSKSIPYLIKATENTSSKYRDSNFKQKEAPLDAWLFLGNAYRVNNMLDKAIETYTYFKTLTRSSDEIEYADQQISACRKAMVFMNSPVAVKFTNLGEPVNGTSSNFRAVISGDGKTLVYINELPFYDAVYYARFTAGKWSEPENITSQLQSDGDQYVSSLSADGTVLYLTKESYFNSDIYESMFSAGKWSVSTPLKGNVNTKYWESHASISADGKTLYFTSNRKKGLGNMDIYMSTLQGDGTWGEPANLGEIINTGLNEDTPFIMPDGKTLYFSSQGHDNMGGYDIFFSELANGQWSTPINPGYPVNTTDDDLFFYPWHSKGTGYISLIRDEGFGKEDIYAVQQAGDVDLTDLLCEVTGEYPEKAVVNEVVNETVNEKAPENIPAEVEKEAEKEVVTEILIDPIYFDFESVAINEAAKAQTNKILEVLAANPEAKIMLIGHSDAKGPAEYNLRLSVSRAESIMKYLVGKGIDPGRISVSGKGETNFVAINTNADGTDNPEGRQLNRRVEPVISGLDKNIILKRTPVPEALRYKND